jgi:hypothetical protein
MPAIVYDTGALLATERPPNLTTTGTTATTSVRAVHWPLNA